MSTKLIGVIVAFIALLAAAMATGTGVYYVMAIALAIIVVYAVASVVWTLLTVSVEMNGARSRAVRGETIMVIITVRHSAIFPIGAATVVMNVPGSVSGTQEITMNVAPFRKHRFRNPVHCPHRGEYIMGISHIIAEDLFGLIRVKRKVKGKTLKVTVIPNVSETEAIPPRASDTGTEFRSRTAEDNAEPADVRNWQDGDELKKVHWKLTARRQILMVRTFEESARPDTLIVPDVTEITALRDQRLTLEDCICESALSAAKAQLGAGYPVYMPLQSARPMEIAGRWYTDLPTFTDALTRVRFDSPYSYEQLLIQLSQRVQRTGAIILITGKLTSRVADIAIRMQLSNVRVRLIFVSDAPRREALEMLERIRMAGVDVRKVDPRAEDDLPFVHAENS